MARVTRGVMHGASARLAAVGLLAGFALIGGASVHAAAAAGAQPASPAGEPAPDMRRAALEFLALLAPEARERAVLPFDHANRKDWHYTPRSRSGLPIRDMTTAQRHAAHDLLRVALSSQGYLKATAIIDLEIVLGRLEGRPSRRDPELYFFTIFGDPSGDSPWGWRAEGHHLSLNFTSTTGRIDSATPAFIGANPAEVPEGPRAGLRILAAEEDLARALLASLDARQRDEAIIADRAPRDIILSPGRKAGEIGEPTGVAYAAMTPQQRELLLRLMREYVGNLEQDAADEQWARIEQAGLERIHFAWAGSTRRGEGHYYRIHGPTFVIEYDNTQNNANHVHTVWRDLTNDFGQDVLRQHYERDHR